ncbi:hypothetical protein GNI_233550 [Gregarina niphandrodes]|uniref:Uncharacterized protein n=1 Tax=Gregarina niphandrodes TaxID=110365 RepID=A0A023AVC2_GRENI|nr:hypothetical protein GNI_233550 [Gregarina niphandrodes]EZG42734.1 hypothetical protein GNI_233550 [Gregarina niphandrodes]|eukprot:XP_011133988.1 hypothetical protein GNI_233550 [Gregarina niphandrodes]
MTNSIPLPAVHNYANSNEAQGAYILTKRYLSQIKDYAKTTAAELQVYTDNALLAKSLASPIKINPDTETMFYARKMKILLQTMKLSKLSFHYVQGKLNPADLPSRRTNKTQDRPKTNAQINAKISAHIWTPLHYYRTQKHNRTPTRPQPQNPDRTQPDLRSRSDLDLTEIPDNTRKRPIISETTATTEPTQISETDQKRRRLPT